MEVWVLQWERPSDMETNITLWATEKAAYQQAINEINECIGNEWDMDNPDMLTYSEKMSDLADKGNFREALEVWAEYQDLYNERHAEYYSVYVQEVLNGEDSDEDIPLAVPVPYKASSPGATCRGSHQEYNQYAYADRPDGTYLCTQCKTFSHIFGSNSKP
jgi:hypothetical protein